METNTIVLEYSSQFNVSLKLKTTYLTLFELDDNENWMMRIGDITPISGISIPGTHDSAAVGTYYTSLYTCQNRLIIDQLKGGIRMLDIRIKVKGKTKESLVTCHGDQPFNEYDSLKSVFDDCKKFLSDHPSESIIMSLKVDDWADYKTDQKNGIKLISLLLNDYASILYKNSNLPSMSEARGKLILLNRIDDTLDFGTPIDIPYNIEGEYLKVQRNRNFPVYVQDKCTLNVALASRKKFDLVLAALKKRYSEFKTNEVYINFCSSSAFLMGVYVMSSLLSHLGEKSYFANREWVLGWLLFDYPFEKYQTDRYGYINIVDMIIDVNFREKYGEAFKLLESDDL
jgi:hypothetical protein